MNVVSIKEIKERVFGRDFNNSCNDPMVIECQMWDCQKANKCQLRGRPILATDDRHK